MTLLDKFQFLLNSTMSVKQVTIEYDENPYSIHLEERTIYLWSEIRNELFPVARFNISQKEFEDNKYDLARLLRSQFFYPVDKQDGVPTYVFNFNAMRLEFAQVMRDYAPVEGDYPPEPDFEG